MEQLLPSAFQLPGQNLDDRRRTISATIGTTLIALAVLDGHRSAPRRIIRAGVGIFLLCRGVSGYCPMTSAIMTKRTGEPIT